MELGKRILQARLEAGLSQRQLCGEEITRNMLSQIEHGTARPSMSTLQYLAGRLGKSVSYFLEEDTLSTPNQAVMMRARTAFDSGDYSGAVQALDQYREPDEVYDREMYLIKALSCLELAKDVVSQEKGLYAVELLEESERLFRKSGYFREELEGKRLILLGKAKKRNLKEICEALPSLDEHLLIRAQAAMEKRDYIRCGQLLDAAEDRKTPMWNLLRGDVYLQCGAFSQAAELLHRAEAACPEEVAPKLEQCYRELGDFKQAYFYACKQKK